MFLGPDIHRYSPEEAFKQFGVRWDATRNRWVKADGSPANLAPRAQSPEYFETSNVGPKQVLGGAGLFLGGGLLADAALSGGAATAGGAGAADVFTIPKTAVTRAANLPTPAWLTALIKGGAATAIPLLARQTSVAGNGGGSAGAGPAGTAVDQLIPELVKRFQQQNSRVEQSNGLYDAVLKMATGRLPLWARE